MIYRPCAGMDIVIPTPPEGLGTDIAGTENHKIGYNMRRRSNQKFNRLVPRDQSKRVILLERRRYGSRGCIIAAWSFRILGILCLLYCCGIALAGFGTYFFLIWGMMGALFLGLGALLDRQKLLAMVPKWLKITAVSCFCLGLLLFCLVEGLIFTQYHAQAQPGADYCIILGAQWKSSGPSTVLRRRLDKAVAYLQANPDTKVIVSGGQGANEPFAEALGMEDYLIQAGISPDRILTEAESSSTFENLVFSGRLLDPENDNVVIVTTNFHMFRALKIAQKQGYAHVEGLASDSVLGMEPNNLLREFFGIVKDFLMTNL